MNAAELKALRYKEFLKTDYWRAVAKSVKERDGNRCVVCNSAKKLAAHHRTYRHHGEEHLFLGDLTTLCEVCHSRHHFPPPPEPKPKVIVKTVIEYREKKQPSAMGISVWSFLNQSERDFYKQAAQALSMKAKKLCVLGREEVTRMMAENKVTPQSENAPHPKLDGYYLVGDITSVEADMPEGEQITMTNLILKKCRANGAFTTATIKALGVTDLSHGWPQLLVGKVFPRATIYAAMRGRHLYSTQSFKRGKAA